MLKGIALGLAASLALVSLAASAKIVNKNESVELFYFRHSIWANKETGRLSQPVVAPAAAGGAMLCRVWPNFGPFVIQQVELLTSNAADVSPNKVIDTAGHALSVSGIIVTEHVDPTGVQRRLRLRDRPRRLRRARVGRERNPFVVVPFARHFTRRALASDRTLPVRKRRADHAAQWRRSVTDRGSRMAYLGIDRFGFGDTGLCPRPEQPGQRLTRRTR